MTRVLGSRTIEFWLEYASNYTYLSVMRIEALAASRGVSIIWQPFLLGPIFKSFGWETSPFVIQKAKGTYMWSDMARQCRKYRIPWRRPTSFPRHSVLAARVGLALADSSAIGEYSRRVCLRNFAQDGDISAVADIADILRSIDLDPDVILELAQTEEIKRRLREQTESAQARGIFGAPSFFVGEDLFWGNDRLEDALELAAS